MLVAKVERPRGRVAGSVRQKHADPRKDIQHCKGHFLSDKGNRSIFCSNERLSVDPWMASGWRLVTSKTRHD